MVGEVDFVVEADLVEDFPPLVEDFLQIKKKSFISKLKQTKSI